MRKDSKNYLISVQHNTRQQTPGDGEIKTLFPTYTEAATFAKKYTRKQGIAIIWDIANVTRLSVYKDPKEAREIWKRGEIVREEYNSKDYDYSEPDTGDSRNGSYARRDPDGDSEEWDEPNRDVFSGTDSGTDYEEFIQEDAPYFLDVDL